ncbi:UNVERIFIED_CONTAM: hypothetical protein Sradi_7131400 [Sesamum radiatum]|uniref:Reverse transcriptase domain-containing protein n=1 Tax=Sesamum radiatum TaxID=300843 RepID=A0AAW2J0G4_SESRA
MYGVVCRLKQLKASFRALRKVKGDLAENVRQAKEFLEVAQALFDLYKEDYLFDLVHCCRLVYCSAVKLQTGMLQQRAKMNWLKHGDQCTKMFFRKINARRAQQRVYQIITQSGERLTDVSQVTAEFVSFFQNLLGGSHGRRDLNIDFLRQGLKHTLTHDEGDSLIAPISAAEVKEAVFDIADESAPGPDGYTSLFFKAAWPTIGDDVCGAVKEFFQSGKLLKQINATVLVLVPKVQLPTRVSDYRPISCCNVIYKTITKIMVKRLQRVLHLLVDYSQNAFVPGRSISDNVLLAQELLAGYNQAKLPQRCTIKVDIQKAYDSVEWDFLLEGLKVFNFPPKFIIWVEQCISTATFSVSLNGALYGFFQSSRGIRQGDPISPYLFVLVMELWRSLLYIRIQAAEQFQYHWKCKDMGLVNLCFADDVLLFCRGDGQSIQVIKEVLTEFAAMSGLHINPLKSQIILSRSVQSQRQQLIDIMGFQEGTLPLKYLGVPLVASRLSIADCQPLIQKVEGRLAGWNTLNLSFAGRLQLLKSVLGSLHTYWASVFILPISDLKVIEERMRGFLWQGASGRGVAKVSWEQVCRPKKEGGLGLRRVLHMNQALIFKQIWRLLQEDQSSIWVAWALRHRLRNQTLWTVKVSTAPWCWKKLVKLSSLIKPGLVYRVGDGNKFKLWLDLWHERGPLIATFPRGPSITGLPADSLLREVLQQNRWVWPSATDFDINDIVSSLPATHPGESDSIL